MNVRSVNLFFVLAILASASLFYRRHQGEKVEIDRLEEGLANMMSGLSPAKAFFFETTAAEIPLLFWCRNAVFPVFLDKGAGAAGDTVLLVCPADVAEPDLQPKLQRRSVLREYKDGFYRYYLLINRG